MRYLNVAEKNDAAKNIANHLSRGTSRRREGYSPYNKIYEFEADVLGQKSEMVMTSVSGHLLALEFGASYKSWQSVNPLALFDAPVYKYCPENYQKIKKTLEHEVKKCQGLIIWTDCDREGENIGFEIIQVCTAARTNLNIYRARFSEITGVSVHRALSTLGQPDKNVSDAVDVRQELDLRIGAAFTRFQTLRLQRVFPAKLSDSLVSYGSCQFPTLGFVVERYRAVENFIQETFWKIKMNHTLGSLSVDFTWERGRLFDELACRVLHDVCVESPRATVVDVKTKPKSKWRPLPLDTVELEKLASRKLKINAKETMRLAEKLYTQGYISYPRTETNQYPSEMNLAQLVGQHVNDRNWGAFAQGILDGGGPAPRQGNKSDKAHPPIHPTKYTGDLTGNEQRLYEFIVRSFLACCSKDAQGQETTVSVDLAGEKFQASGLMITARNYLEVYPYDKWSSKEIHIYERGQVFDPTSIDMVDGSTSPPNLLTEADLIALMEKHGIGTDATHAEHIETIKSRSYVALSDEIHFVPGLLGMGLVEGYDAMGLAVAKPDLRANLEADLKAISEGRKQPDIVLAEQISKYREVYLTVTAEATKIDNALAERFNERPNDAPEIRNMEAMPAEISTVLKCPKCTMDMVIRQKKNSEELFISCTGYPHCKNAVWFSNIVRTVDVLPNHCPHCGPNYKLLKFNWRNNSINHLYPAPYTGCIGGCDANFIDILKINIASVKSNVSETRTAYSNHIENNHINNNRNIQNVNRDQSVLPIQSRNTRNAVPSTEPVPRARQFSNPDPRARQDANVKNTNAAVPSNEPVPRARVLNNPVPRARQDTNVRNSLEIPEDNNVTCGCNQPAILLTVKKQTPNFGKKFYKCSSGNCDFFLWAPENTAIADTPPPSGSWPAATPPSSTSTTRGWGITPSTSVDSRRDNSSHEDVKCECNMPCKKLTVQKEGPTKGRQFFTCPNHINSRCNFFQWADTAAPIGDWGNSGGGGGGHRARGGARGRGTARDEAGASAPRGARKCGHCRQEGHTRNKCPNLHN